MRVDGEGIWNMKMYGVGSQLLERLIISACVKVNEDLSE